jgi:hypothetical protein
MSLWFAAVLGLAPAASVSSDAEAGAMVLQWDAPATCPDASAVLADAVALLRDPSPQRPLRARGEVSRLDGGFAVALSITTDGSEGSRRMEAAGCDELARMVALVLALAIDPRAAEAEVETDPAPDPGPTPQPEPDPVPVPALEPAAEPSAAPEPGRDPTPTSFVAPRRRPLRALVIQLGAGPGFFALPAASALLTFGLAYVQPWVRAEFALQYWTPTTTQSPVNALVGGRFQLFVASLRGCFAPSFGRVELPVCAVVDAGALFGRGTGPLQPPGTAAAPWVGFGGGPAVIVRLGPARRWGLWARVEGVGVPLRPTFETTPSGRLWRAPAGALRAAAGVELRFGVGARETPGRP